MNIKIKKTLLSLGLVVLFVFSTLLSYVIYVSAQYYRIDDELNLTTKIKNNQESKIKLNEEYSISTFNIGFGAYSRDFSFFLDTGYSKDKTYLTGKYSKAFSKEEVLKNTNGSIMIEETLNTDFMFFQEVDTKSTRSYKINQYDMIQSAFRNYSSVFAENAHSAYLFYPLNDPHGKINSGIATFSKYQINEAVRRQLPITDDFISKLFDLDRCFLITRLPIEGLSKELVLINIHMSAYDEGGVFRKQQMDLIQRVLEKEYQKGNYVILGGDFNHDIADSIGKFKTEQETPNWVSVISPNDLTTGYYIAASSLVPSCRSCEIPYEKDVNFFVTVDGFIVSNNIELIHIENISEVNGNDTLFMYSDHNPVYFKFKLL